MHHREETSFPLIKPHTGMYEYSSRQAFMTGSYPYRMVTWPIWHPAAETISLDNLEVATDNDVAYRNFPSSGFVSREVTTSNNVASRNIVRAEVTTNDLHSSNFVSREVTTNDNVASHDIAGAEFTTNTPVACRDVSYRHISCQEAATDNIVVCRNVATDDIPSREAAIDGFVNESPLDKAVHSNLAVTANKTTSSQSRSPFSLLTPHSLSRLQFTRERLHYKGIKHTNITYFLSSVRASTQVQYKHVWQSRS